MNKTPSRDRVRHSLLAAGLAAALTASLAACGSSSSSPAAAGGGDCQKSSGKVTLTYWSWVPGMDKVVALWNSSHPDVQVSLENVPSGDKGTYQKLSNAVKAGSTPDLSTMEYDHLPEYRLQGGLRDVAGCGVASHQGDFQDWTWRQVSFGENAAYAIPQDTGPMALYYRTDLFAKYGIAVPQTWADFEAAAKQVHQADPSVYLSNGATGGAWFASMAWQHGASWFSLDKDAWKASVNDKATQETAEYWQRLRSEGLLSNAIDFSDQFNQGLNEDKLLTWAAPVWAVPLVKTDAPKTAGKWGVAPLPQWNAGEAANGNWGGSSTAVFKNSKHPYEAAQFALWLSTDPQALALEITNGGLYPAAKAGAALPELQQPDPFYGDQKVYDVFAKASGEVNTGFQWGPVMTNTYGALGDAVNASVNGTGSLSAGLDAAQRKTVDAMKQQGLKVQQ
ncbi:ABC transporter substrate-binding protein [Kitasatospora misakiensis]|uniref:ABC transporter substrate-binding protein n=1 Tax=Kitasatospora misakiensis TaxID=67330 RepID=A0ABW0X8A1_9ACTN